MMMPARVAIALQDCGWYLRSEIIWHKPNPMPEAVKDRPTKSHEQIYLLSKSSKYYYDAEAIKEPVSGNAHARGTGVNPKSKTGVGWGYADGEKPKPRAKQNESFSGAINELVDSRNKRSVWTVPTNPCKEAHFATFPPKLIIPCIDAGSAKGDTVFDPFTGSGTTGMVAADRSRNFIGAELNPEYCEIARRRIDHNR